MEKRERTNHEVAEINRRSLQNALWYSKILPSDCDKLLIEHWWETWARQQEREDPGAEEWALYSWKMQWVWGLELGRLGSGRVNPGSRTPTWTGGTHAGLGVGGRGVWGHHVAWGNLWQVCSMEQAAWTSCIGLKISGTPTLCLSLPHPPPAPQAPSVKPGPAKGEGWEKGIFTTLFFLSVLL